MMRRHLERQNEKKDTDVDYLLRNDPGDVNEKVLKMDDQYARTGIHRPNWSKDFMGKEKEVMIPKGKLLDQYSSSGKGGRYFAPKGTPYEKLELNDVPDKRELHRYEVIKDLPASKGKIAQQPWNQGKEYDEKKAATQFKTTDTARDLVKKGYLREIPVSEENRGRRINHESKNI